MILGLDVGQIRTKAAVCDPEKDWAVVFRQILTPGLGQQDPSNWAHLIKELLKRAGLMRLKAIGISLALPIVHARVWDPTEKFLGLAGQSLEQLETKLLPYRVAFLHDGASAVLGQFAAEQKVACLGAVGFLAFGGSIGFGFTVKGQPLMHPYTSWVSHIQLRPDFQGNTVPCLGCGQVGCWRAIYQCFAGSSEDPKIDQLPDLVEATSQGIAAVSNTVPMDRLYLGGGWATHFLNPETCLPEVRALDPFDTLLAQLKTRLGAILNPRDLIHFAQGGEYSGAIGAAYFAGTSLRPRYSC